jgi:hypothetical protein
MRFMQRARLLVAFQVLRAMADPTSVFAVWWFVRPDKELLRALNEEIKKEDVPLLPRRDGSSFTPAERALGIDGGLALTDEGWEIVWKRLRERFGYDCIIRVVQRAGQAVRVIPGWLHQVNNKLPCFKLAVEAIYVEELSEVAFANELIAEFGSVPDYTAFPIRLSGFLLDQFAGYVRQSTI